LYPASFFVLLDEVSEFFQFILGECVNLFDSQPLPFFEFDVQVHSWSVRWQLRLFLFLEYVHVSVVF